MDIFGLESAAPSPHFNALAWGFRSARVLQVAVRIALFTELEARPAQAERIARRLKTDSAMTERLLVALAALDLARNDDGVWRNTLAASLYLVEGQPLFQGQVIELAAREWERYHALERMVREGRGAPSAFDFGQEKGSRAAYPAALYALTAAGLAQRAARMVPLAGRDTLLDVGGAPGAWSVAFAQRYPALKVTLLDDAATVARSQAVVAQFAARNVTVRAEDSEKGWGSGVTGALLLSRLRGSTDGSTLARLVRAHDALKAHGLLIVHSHLLDNDYNGGGEAAFRNLTDDACTLEQMTTMIEEAGFERVQLLHSHPAEGDLLIGYKQDTLLADDPAARVEAATPELALAGTGDYDEDVLLATHRRAWSGAIERLN